MHPFRLGLALVMLLTLSTPLGALAQQGTPSATPAASPGEIVASGLANPRGMTWGPDGTLYVALAGNGGTSGAVVKIENGTPTPFVTGLPSVVSDQGSVNGAADVAFLDGVLYVLVEGGGAGNKHPDQPSGVYKVADDGTATLLADLNAWVQKNPTASPVDHDPEGNPFKMIAGDGALWVVIATPDQIVTVKPDGTVARAADLTTGGMHDVLTGIAASPDGGIDVSTLSVYPYTDGTARVVHVAADGALSDAWTKLTAVTDVAVGSDGTLYTLEMTTGNSTDAPMNPGTGRIVRQTGPDSLEAVASGFTLPVAMRIGPDGMAYVASPAVGADSGTGTIVKVPLG
jgi:hypothetical protein